MLGYVVYVDNNIRNDITIIDCVDEIEIENDAVRREMHVMRSLHMIVFYGGKRPQKCGWLMAGRRRHAHNII
jgi:hypothetical protein